jgi:DMSO/TMAO reductase YedYZ molybdopterin-dependent catalytic subunit
MKNDGLPPGQRKINALLRWNVNHPGIVPENPTFDPKTWTLTISGEVENPMKLSWQELQKLPTAESMSDFHCVEGWSVKNLKWYGVQFKTLIEIVKPTKDGKFVIFQCSDGYTTSLNLKDLLKDNVLLAYKLDGNLLDVPIGGPLRLVVPDKYAYKSAMWVEKIIFSKKKELGFWEKKGYSDTADVWKNDRYAQR